MEDYAEHVNKHLTNFREFAGKFAKVFNPIVETAAKMSTEEPVSAYSVYNAVKGFADNKNSSKRNQTASAKDKKGNKSKKPSYPRFAAGTKAAGKSKSSNMNGQGKAKTVKTKAKSCKRITINNKKPQTKRLAIAKKSNVKNFEGSDIASLVEQLYADDSKKLTKAEEKKKNDLENYLVKQLEMDNAGTGDDESFDSEGLEEKDAYSDYETYSGESVSFSSNETGEEESSSTNEDDNQAAEALAIAILSRNDKKRKSPVVELTKTNSNATTGTARAKKPKKIDDTKNSGRKSLPAAKADKIVVEDISRSRSSLACVDESVKKSTYKAASTKVSTTTSVKLEPLLCPTNIVTLNSIEEGKRTFQWLLNPVTVNEFFAKYWEQKACLIKRQQANYFGHLISFEAIDQMLLINHVEFTKNIDVTSYKNGIRETLNPEGRALPPAVWDHYGQGCSIRLLNPQTFIPALYTLSTTMQEYFQCLVGANAYLTPPNSQGFAPHYDDIEAFVLQIEGRKRWKLYKPRNNSEILPRISSQNFTQQEMGKPVFEEVLEPGDVLYFPRGTIHQASTETGCHSLHITLSVYQKQTFADLFEKMLPIMLQKAIAASVNLRRGLPLHSWQHAGIAFSGNSTKERAEFTKTVTQLMHKCIREMPLQDIVDAGMDQLSKKFQHEALPPVILPAEKLRTVFGSRSHTNERGECVCDYDIDERTNVRLLRANIMRLVKEEEKLRIYYYLDNSKEYCEYEPNFIEIEAMEAASVEILIKSYPQYVGVSQLPLPSDEKKITLVTALWERGLLMMEKPFR